MSRRTVLSSSERESLFALPDNQKDLIQQTDKGIVLASALLQSFRGGANSLIFDKRDIIFFMIDLKGV